MASPNRIKNVQADVPDNRDWIYQPALIELKEFIDLQVHTRRNILDQKSEGACTGFALPTPQIFSLQADSARIADNDVGRTEKSAEPRCRIAGHFVHIDDGAYKTSGRYWSTSEDVEQTAKLLTGSSKYKHFLLYVHGGS